MEILIKTIPHKDQRYPTVGDWTVDEKGNITIKVSELSDWRREALIAVHELIEVLLCKNYDITQEMVDRFDIEFEKHRHPDNDDEPGDDPAAPYARPHCLATSVERMMSAELGVKWGDYEKELNSLP